MTMDLPESPDSPPSRTIRLLLEYDGSRFSGFQKQATGRTVQGFLETHLAQITGEPTIVQGAGRTDAGVHATGQVVSFTTTSRIDLRRLSHALTGLSHHDLVVRQAQEVPAAFRARHAAIWRQYGYRLLIGPQPSPLKRHQAAWVGPQALGVEAMIRVWASLEGVHDFTAWENAGSDRGEHARCHVSLATATHTGEELFLQIRADRFLYRMVRNLVGSVIKVGQGQVSETAFAIMLTGESTRRGGPAAPPEGLCFEAVGYALPWPQPTGKPS